MSLRDQNLHMALMKAIADAVSGFMGDLREEHLDTLLRYYDDTGSKSLAVNLPDGTKIATITLPEGKEFFEVHDEVAFLEWVKANHPNLLEEVVVPPQPEMRFQRVEPAKAKKFLAGLDHEGELPFDPATGEVPDGVTYKPVGRPKSFQVRYESEGRDRVIAAWQQGDLTQLFGSGMFPQIGVGDGS